jgi:hypothetical protein
MAGLLCGGDVYSVHSVVVRVVEVDEQCNGEMLESDLGVPYVGGNDSLHTGGEGGVAGGDGVGEDALRTGS